MAVVITIDGVDRTSVVRRSSLQITKDDAVETLSLTTFDRSLTSSAYRPALGDVVYVTQDTQTIFGGTIEDVQDQASDGLNRGATEVSIRAIGYHLLPADVLVTASYAAGTTTLEVFADLVALLPGVTNGSAVTGGPALPEIAWDHATVASALDQLQTLSGYTWRINGDAYAYMAAPGTWTGPAFTASNAKVIRAFGWQQSRLRRATRVWAKCGSSGAGTVFWSQQWTGDGSRTRFLLDVEGDSAPTAVIENGVEIAVPSATWTYDATRRALVRSSALTNGHTLVTTVLVTYPAWCRAEDEAAVDGGDLKEQVYDYPDVLELAQGVALAEGHLAAQSDAPKRVTLQTREVNVYPWQQCSLTFSDRNISGNYLVRRVRIADAGKAGTLATQQLVYDVELWEGSQTTWLDWWKSKVGGARGGSGAVSGSGVSIINVTGVLEGDLGGSRINGVTHSTWAPVREYRDWTAPASGTYVATVEVWTAHAATSVQPRIYDVTGAAAAVTGSSSTSTTPAEQSLTFSAVAGRKYRLQVLPGNTSNEVYGLGKVRA